MLAARELSITDTVGWQRRTELQRAVSLKFSNQSMILPYHNGFRFHLKILLSFGHMRLLDQSLGTIGWVLHPVRGLCPIGERVVLARRQSVGRTLHLLALQCDTHSSRVHPTIDCLNQSTVPLHTLHSLSADASEVCGKLDSELTLAAASCSALCPTFVSFMCATNSDTAPFSNTKWSSSKLFNFLPDAARMPT